MDPRSLSISDYTYDLPNDRIAQEPLAQRDSSRLLLYRDGGIEDHRFKELPDLLPSGALLVLNNTRVVNARLFFQRSTGARIEVLCLEPAEAQPVEAAFAQKATCTWNGFVGNAKRWKHGEMLELQALMTMPGDDDHTSATPVRLQAVRDGEERVRFSWQPPELTFAEVLEKVGHVPLPPYMKRPDEAADKERYNTVFAKHEGSVAAPTASLHFSPEVLARLDAKGIDRTELTLHVGAGTFLPVKSERMADHAMHGEQVRVPLASLERIRGRIGKGPVVTVGTTALRTLESVYWHGVMLLQGRAGAEMAIGQWEPYGHVDADLPNAAQALDAVIKQLKGTTDQRLVGRTELLIAPGYQVRMADALVTNFHQPQSTLLLLVAAFIGPDWRRVYQHALEHGYRFLSYGDGSLLWKRT
ncbi:MAG: S-adenosylmethionine:tRNA ribosyltransferase-isomerase [Flavobacteriales bacterium]|nr:S-adenosylmethionine:tRNA ribosyltransferase-isomerase [Flavobacteriales bacterium]